MSVVILSAVMALNGFFVGWLFGLKRRPRQVRPKIRYVGPGAQPGATGVGCSYEVGEYLPSDTLVVLGPDGKAYRARGDGEKYPWEASS